MCFAPLLENLSITGREIGTSEDCPNAYTHPRSPPLTGVLSLHLTEGVEHAARLLLALRSGIRFRSLEVFSCVEGDPRWITALVGACSTTLEDIKLEYFSAPLPVLP